LIHNLARLFANGISGAIAGMINIVWGNGSLLGRLSLKIQEKLRFAKTVSSPTGGKQFKFVTPNSITLWRASSLYEKEPETLEWMDSFESGSVFYDIGANVGTYTVYAGVSGKASKVMAFEPEASNYALLNKNIVVNGLGDKVTAINLAVSDVRAMDYLHLASLDTGAAMHSFGSTPSGHGYDGGTMFKQGMLSFSVDEFIATFNPPFPNYIKIDVDGLEKRILNGAQKTLRDSRMKSVLLEIDEGLPEDLFLADQVVSLGYRLLHKKHAPMFDGGPYSKIYNYVFIR
jgi:FkbM family methyltransferase